MQVIRENREKKSITLAKSPFFNYVGQICTMIIDHLPSPGWHHWRRNSFIMMRENLHTVDIFSTIYLPRYVNVVEERPPNMGKKIITFHIY